MVPSLHDAGEAGPPYWKRHADAVARALEPVAAQHPMILVGHSGAGPLLPVISHVTGRPIVAYIFVDAGIPRDGASRLDLMAGELPEAAGPLRQRLADGERFPNWRDQDLRDNIPDVKLRQGVLAELCPQPLVYFAEPIPVFKGWPDAPCGYLKFTSSYDVPAAQAQKEGWEYLGIEGGHFHMLVEPSVVAGALIRLAAQMGIATDPEAANSAEIP